MTNDEDRAARRFARLIEGGRHPGVAAVNRELVTVSCHISLRIGTGLLGGDRAQDTNGIVAA